MEELIYIDTSASLGRKCLGICIFPENPSPGTNPIEHNEKLLSIFSNILHPNHYLNYQVVQTGRSTINIMIRVIKIMVVYSPLK